MRSRNIKPGFFKNYELADCGMAAQLLYIGLWCLADKEGMLLDRPRFIKAEIFPYSDVDINRELTVIELLGNIRRYEVDGIRLIEVVNFKKHQSPHHTEKKSELPKLTDEQHITYCKLKEKTITVNSPLSDGGNPPDSLIPDSLIPDSLIPDSLIPDSLIPDSLIPDSLIPEVNISDEMFTAQKSKKQNHVEKKDPSGKEILAMFGINGQVATDFLKVRKAKRTPLTVTAMEGIAKEALKAGLPVADAVAISTENGWVGFKANWNWQDNVKLRGGYKTAEDLRKEETQRAKAAFLARSKVIEGEVVNERQG